MVNDEILVMNAGHRERQALLRYWGFQPCSNADSMSMYVPFWHWLGSVVYNTSTDSFRFPDGKILTVAEANNLPDQGG